MTDKQKYAMWKHQLGEYLFLKDKEYLDWMKRRFPNHDLHHLLGSMLGKKTTDYLVMPVEHQFHLNVVENNRPKYFTEWLDNSIGFLIDYRNSLSADAWAQKELELKDVIQLINEIRTIKENGDAKG